MLSSLFKVRGIFDVNILVSQSGIDQRVSDIADSYKLRTIQHIDDGVKIENRLARHFKWTFEQVFSIYSESEGVIVIEDDFLFSPDFLEYFELTIPLLKIDPTLFTISAWNDIGFKQNTNDLHGLRRTTFFPGLGWYLTRDMWENNLKDIWPDSDWDWVIRKFIDKNKMEIIIPEISRDYHAASTGTYMKKWLFDQYFKNINYNTNASFRWKGNSDIEHVMSSDHYRYKIIKMLQDNSVEKVWIDDNNMLKSKSSAKKYGVWHEPERGAWNGIRIIWNGSGYTLLIDIVNYPEWKHYNRRPSVNL
jgi:hypothetical protein